MLLRYLVYTSLLVFLAQLCNAQWTYSLTDSYTDPDHSFYTATLKYNGSQSYFNNETNKVIQTLNFTYFFVSAHHLIVRFTDPQQQRWEVPHNPPFPHVDFTKKFAPYEDGLVRVEVTESPFSYKVIRRSTNEVIFDSSAGDLIYSDYYLQFSTSLSTPNIYGLGERAAKLNLDPDATYTIFNKDLPDTLEDGTPGHNLYGYHPVYLLREKSNSFNMVLLRSSVPMDVQIEKGQRLTYKVIGGIIDLNYFVGDTSGSAPETVVKQYHTYLGNWTLQPFWSLGFHQCRWGYKSVDELVYVLGNYSANNLPLDVIWSDINYMDSYIDFTIDQVNYPNDKINAMLETYKKRWVPIIDAGIALNNEIHTMGLNNNVYVKAPNGTNLEGVVWPGKVNYPDFYNPNTSMFWHIGLKELYQQVPYAGIWLDMNEVSNFVEGETGFVNDPNNLLNNPPYKPSLSSEQIYSKTMRMDAVHYGNVLEYYAHNTFGLLEAEATFNFLKGVDDLVFILTRSSFYGSGKYTAHWTGDNDSTYEFLLVSIAGIVNSGLYGMPLAGADVCGFGNDTTPELCARWFQLGALYPFSRNHNTYQTIAQEPYALGPTVLETARQTLRARYSIVRHYYTQFLRQNGTGTVFRPVFFEFPNDDNLYNTTLAYVDSQFLVGDALMAAPALNEGQDSVEVYFPQDNWYDYKSGELLQSFKEEPNTINYPAPLNTTAPLFIRGGHIIPTQEVDDVNRTEDLSNTYQLTLAFKQSEIPNTYKAQGVLAGIQNFEDENILTKCKNANCLYNIDATIVVSKDQYNLTLIFDTQGDSINYEQIRLSKLLMFGDWPVESHIVPETGKIVVSDHSLDARVLTTRSERNVIEYTFSNVYDIEPEARIQINGSLVQIINQ